ncbi:helix-turn-helix domain-containing protein [Mycolicibacterium septicum]|uniref:PucR family transcriptional regulator n=1 Tax=Mycolicibacterium septicum TaxID=98668 RepID=UPI0023E2CD5E|nr:helix-turn-helix domain-containing protein [Mycolicibacterium septicum]MDF3341086.1 helix-turn-helix domain-containing protein [Mycolicibacterium septicum]
MDPAVATASAEVMDRLMARQVAVSQSVQQALASQITQLRGDRELVQLLGASVAGNVETIFNALRHDISLDNIEPPTAALEYARRVAQRGVPMDALVRAYRLGHSLVIDAASDEVNAAGLDARIGLAVFERITSVSFRYIDWISQQVVVVYEEERDRWLTNQNSARALRVREVLEAPASAPASDPEALTAALRYPVQRTHLAIVLWWPADSEHEDGLGRLEAVLREIADAVGPQGSPLFVAADRNTGWGWIPLTSAAAVTAVDAVRTHLATRSDSPTVALGTPSYGVEGFRRSHRQAMKARGVALAAGTDGVIAAGDPGLAAAALIAENLDDAREFVSETLGALASDTANDARLRETLRVYLHDGASYKSAGEKLNLHFNSVKYRVGRAEERRGRPVDDDRLDVELALLLCRRYGTAVLSGP